MDNISCPGLAEPEVSEGAALAERIDSPHVPDETENEKIETAADIRERIRNKLSTASVGERESIARRVSSVVVDIDESLLDVDELEAKLPLPILSNLVFVEDTPAEGHVLEEDKDHLFDYFQYGKVAQAAKVAERGVPAQTEAQEGSSDYDDETDMSEGDEMDGMHSSTLLNASSFAVPVDILSEDPPALVTLGDLGDDGNESASESEEGELLELYTSARATVPVVDVYSDFGERWQE
eukprot:GFYU01008651.1.p1 GENE.GFYU01008651.1~~GFYU01008651.1.p1  ORF type:complete len:265 (+),score=34.87 GFYU01008651.1:83-796(+)